MKERWIVIADAGRARILSAAAGTVALDLVQILQNPAGRQRASELVSDRPGRVEKSCGNVQSSASPRTTPHDHVADEFARAIADLLDEKAAGENFDELVLVAPPQFLGQLRAHLGAQAAGRVICEVPKDLTRLSPRRIAVSLQKSIRLAGFAAAAH
jgi:protein required for attachment to host cells